MPGIQPRQSGQIMSGSGMPAARQRREIPVAGSPAGDRQSRGLPPYLPHPQYLSAVSRVLKKVVQGGTSGTRRAGAGFSVPHYRIWFKKVVQGGTAVAESVPLFRLAFFRWYSAKPRLARLYHLSHLYHLKNRRNENGEKGLKRQRLKGGENKGNGLAL